MKEFKKRRYKSISEFIDDLKFILANRKKIKSIHKGDIIDDDFRERLMMAITSVTGCRYCSSYHSKKALKSGISSEELSSLLDRTLEDSPDEEKIALLYAQNWAHNDGEADQDFKKKLVETYGNKKSEAINLAIRSIQFGNLLGNTFDYLLYRITF